MSRPVQPSSEQLPACFACRNEDCLIKGELLSLYNAAVKPKDCKPELFEFVNQLFNCLTQMVQRQVIKDAEMLGKMLGAIFDWCMSLLYAEKMRGNIGWLYCPQAQMGFYPYIKSCPRCGRVEKTEIPVHKPPSDTIGKYASLCLGVILSEVCRVSQNGFDVRILPSSRGDVDMLIFDEAEVVLCEVKSSPLYLMPLCVSYQRPLETSEGGELAPVTTHTKITVDNLEARDLYLYLEGYLEGGYCISVRFNQKKDGTRCFKDDTRYLSVEYGSDSEKLCKTLNIVGDSWARMYEGYASRWQKNEELRWFTCGCGAPVDDTKNAPGLDRTDDIKKGVYQMLKLAEKYSRGCRERRVHIALLSNMDPVVHYDEYLKGFEDALWTHESDIQECTEETVSVDRDDLLPFYDMLFTLTKSWFRDDRLKQAFSVETLFRALKGQQE